MTPDQQQFLREHRLGALATGRRDGSPQLSWIAYNYDGTDIVLQMGGKSAKARNISRRERVVLLVPDGTRNLVVYGEAELLPGGPERRDAVRRVRSGGPRTASDDDSILDAELDERGSVALRIVPRKALGRIEARR